MKVTLSIALVVATLFLTACVTPNSGERVVEAGARPTEAQATVAIMDYLRRTLKDSDSLKQFRIRSGPDIITWYQGRFYGGGNEQAWLVCYEYNAKNSYGGYVGVTTHGLVLRLNGDTATVVQVNWAATDRNCF